MKETAIIRIIIADDHELMRAGYTATFRDHAQIQLLATAANGKELVSLIEEHQPDLVLVDVQMPIMNGVEATRIIKEKFPLIKIIAISMFTDSTNINMMLNAGASGYLGKTASNEEIIDAISMVYRGDLYYCEQTAKSLETTKAGSQGRPGSKASTPGFSDIELTIIRYICQEMSNKEIGAAMFINKRTVEWHRSNILQKIKAKNVAGITTYAISHGLVKIPGT